MTFAISPDPVHIQYWSEQDNKKLQAEYRKLKASIEASSDGNSGNGQMNNSDLLRRLSNLEKIVYGRE